MDVYSHHKTPSVRILRVAVLFASLCSFATPSTADEVAPDPKSKAASDLKENRECSVTTPELILSKSYNFSDIKAKDFPIEIPAEVYRPDVYAADQPAKGTRSALASYLKRGPEGGPIVIRLLRPGSILPGDWQNSYLNGTALTKEKGQDNRPLQVERIQMTIREKDEQTLVIDAALPTNTNALADERWTIVPVLCGGKENKVLGYGSASVLSISVTKAWIISFVSIVIFWISISIASLQLNKMRLDALWSKKITNQQTVHIGQDWTRRIWQFSKAASPLFISQDSLGIGSLARFQILLFTTVVGLVLLFIFIHSGYISNLSTTVLLLLGVTVAGGTFARMTGDWIGISPISRRWLIGSKILVSQREKPRWADLFETQGEMDVAKIQALLFTTLIAISLLTNGFSGLGAFNLPEQVVYLAAISQGAYVFGKLLPADTRKTVESDLDMMRKSATALVADLNNVQFQLAYGQARQAAKQTLEQTYMERFDGVQFDASTTDPKNVL